MVTGIPNTLTFKMNISRDRGTQGQGLQRKICPGAGRQRLQEGEAASLRICGSARNSPQKSLLSIGIGRNRRPSCRRDCHITDRTVGSRTGCWAMVSRFYRIVPLTLSLIPSCFSRGLTPAQVLFWRMFAKRDLFLYFHFLKQQIGHYSAKAFVFQPQFGDSVWIQIL